MSINRKFSRLRLNPSLGMPGMPHTWVTRNGDHVSAGDQVEYWSSEGGYHDRKKVRRRATVMRYLVFDDHVQVKRGPFGATVDDSNFIRVVRRAGGRRSNPTSGPTVAIRVYFRGKPDGEIRHIPARFFRWHPAYHGRKSYTAGGSSLGGQLERARDDYVRKIAPGNVGWEEVYSSTHYEKAARKNPSSSSGKWTLRPDGVYRKEVAGLVCTVRQSINYAWDWRVCRYGQSQPLRDGFGKTLSEAKAAAEIAAQSYGSRNNPRRRRRV